MGTGAGKMFEQHLNASLERLKTDYVDCYYLHGLAGNQIELLHDPNVKAAFEALKKQGKTRFCGLSCHDARLPEILEAAADCGWIDQVMFKYNFRDVGGRTATTTSSGPSTRRRRPTSGLVAMKTQGGAINFPNKMADLQSQGLQEGSRGHQDRLDGRPDSGRRQRDDHPQRPPRERRRQQRSRS